MNVELRSARVRPAPSRKGFGLTLIKESLPYHLDAQTHLNFGDDELRCSIKPIDPMAEPVLSAIEMRITDRASP